MATIKAVVRKQRADGLYPVYIRIGHLRQKGYIKTNKVISPKYITENGDFKDSVVNEYCAILIRKYYDMLNRKDITKLSVNEVVEYLTSEDTIESFSDYAKLHISRMERRGQERNAKNYKLAVGHLERCILKISCIFVVVLSHRSME